jgi:hypothetical protein
MLTPEIEDRHEVEVGNWALIRIIDSLWTFQLLEFEVFQVRLQKKPLHPFL